MDLKKFCKNCKKEKSLNLFYKDKSQNDGHAFYCKECRRLLKMKIRISNPEESKIKDKKYRESHKDILRKIDIRYRSKNNRKVNDYKKEFVNSPCKTDLYIDRLPPEDDAKIVNNTVTILCKKCRNRFAPNRTQVELRVRAFEGKKSFSEYNIYCSDNCKNTCVLYRARINQPDPRLRKPKSETDNARACQTKTLKQLQCDHNKGQSYCEKCGDFIDIELHHTLPIAQFAGEAVNPAGHMLLCAGCHVELHRVCA